MRLNQKHRKIIDALWGSAHGTTSGVLGVELGYQDRNLRTPLEELFGIGYIEFRRSEQDAWHSHNETVTPPADPRFELCYRLTQAARIAVPGR